MIKSLDLDTMFKPSAHAQIKFKLFKFSGGEVNIKLNTESLINVQKVLITHRIVSSDNLMEIAIAADALKRNGIKDIDLFIPYLPYARQDRVMVKGESLTIKVFAKIINELHFNTVYVFDAHSDVGPALIDNCIIISPEEIINNILTTDFNSETIIIIPDAGAAKKFHSYDFYKKYNVIECSKVRDTATGKLSGFNVPADNLYNRKCIILDDICDGGRTFIGLANELHIVNASDVYLYISHGIFSHGLDTLSEELKMIYTTNSFNDVKPKTEFIKQIKLYI